jgi:GNAT superfamily N-acetyltransferase
MQKIQPNQYNRILPLVDASSLHGHLAFAYAVLEQRQGGQVFAEDCPNPRYALVCNDSGFFLAFGEPEESDLVAQVRQLFHQKLVEENTALFGTSPAWDAPLAAAFAPFQAQATRRLGFRIDPQPGRPPLDWRERIPPGYHIAPIDAALCARIADGSATNGYGIDPWFIRIMGGPEGYAAHGLGCALMHGEQIASLCGYCAFAHSEAELEVGTVPAYQGKGFATLASAAFLEQCQQKGLLPVYTCESKNMPSLAVAHKLGFIEVEEIVGYSVTPVI